MSQNINLCLFRFLIPMSNLSPFDTFYFVMLKFSSTYSSHYFKYLYYLARASFCQTECVKYCRSFYVFRLYLFHWPLQDLKQLFIYLFIFVKKKKKRRRNPQIGFANCNALTLTTPYLPCSSLFIVTHFFPYINIHIPKVI